MNVGTPRGLVYGPSVTEAKDCRGLVLKDACSSPLSLLVPGLSSKRSSKDRPKQETTFTQLGFYLIHKEIYFSKECTNVYLCKLK